MLIVSILVFCGGLAHFPVAREAPAGTALAAHPANFPVKVRVAAEHFAASIVAATQILVAPEENPTVEMTLAALGKASIAAAALAGLVVLEARHTRHIAVATALTAWVGAAEAVLPPTALLPSAIPRMFDSLEQGSQPHYSESL